MTTATCGSWVIWVRSLPWSVVVCSGHVLTFGTPAPQEFHLKDPESVRKVVQHSNVVINLIGRDYETWCVCVGVCTISLPCDSYRNFKYNEVHVNGARVIAEACQQAGVQRLIHFSALNADTSSPSHFLQSKVQSSGGKVCSVCLVL